MKKTDFMALRELLKHNRSCRRFTQECVSEAMLEELVELVRYTSSGRNAQPLRYRLVWRDEEREALFPSLAWAGYFKDWDGPEQGERPMAYLVQCLDTRLGTDCLCDDGLQLEAITLGATAMGMSGCIIKAFNAQNVSEVLGLPDVMKPRYVLALGFPNERIEIEDMPAMPDANFRYYRTPDGVHHVPKRTLKELIIS